jgi:SAM-dependent methyltransferase
MYSLAALTHENVGDKLAGLRDTVTQEIAGEKGTARILDLATGRGYQARNIFAHGYQRTYACDMHPGRTVQARNLNLDTKIGFTVVDMRCLAFREAICHAITISCALHDLTPHDIESCLMECHRVLRFGGRLIIMEPRYLQDIRSPLRRKMYEIGCNLLDESVNMREFLRLDITRRATKLGLIPVRRLACWHSILCVYTFEKGIPSSHLLTKPA